MSRSYSDVFYHLSFLIVSKAKGPVKSKGVSYFCVLIPNIPERRNMREKGTREVMISEGLLHQRRCERSISVNGKMRQSSSHSQMVEQSTDPNSSKFLRPISLISIAKNLNVKL